MANLWIDTSGGSCTRHGTPGGYIDSEACSSFQTAYSAAQSGDTVNIVDGTYGGQGLAAGTKTLTFRAAGPGRPNFGHFVAAAQNITVRGILIEDRNDISGICSTSQYGVLSPCGANQTYDNVIVDGLDRADKSGIDSPGGGFVLKNSEVRNILDQKGFGGGADDMLIENNYWHNIRLVTDGVHNECAFVDGGDRQVWRGNLFDRCPTMALFFTNWSAGLPYGDVLVENNVFTPYARQHAAKWHSSCAFKIGSG